MSVNVYSQYVSMLLLQVLILNVFKEDHFYYHHKSRKYNRLNLLFVFRSILLNDKVDASIAFDDYKWFKTI